MSSSKYINEDTYQTLQEVSIETQSDYEKAIKPLWVKQEVYTNEDTYQTIKDLKVNSIPTIETTRTKPYKITVPDTIFTWSAIPA